MSISVGLVGARGYVGRELLKLIGVHSELQLSFASSREWDGRAISDMLEGEDIQFPDQYFEAHDPVMVAERDVDVLFLGLPNGKSSPFVEAISHGKSETLIIDLSGDHRHHEKWVYGLPEQNRELIIGHRYISNPGCYATAAQLAIKPLKGLWAGPVQLFGISGWSGAGTTPSRKNDLTALSENIIPYAMTGHAHEAEIIAHSGSKAGFTPSVASFFRGLTVLASGYLTTSMKSQKLGQLYSKHYGKERFIGLTTEPAEPAMAAGSHHCFISLPQIDEDSGRVVISAALDNLLKGAASQAIQNMNLALGFPEELGLKI